MANLLLILRYRLLGGLRWVRDHAFVSFVLAPMIVGGSVWVLWEAIGASAQQAAVWLPGGSHLDAAALAAVALSVAIHFGAALEETFGLRRGDAALDAQPIALPVRFHADLLTLAVRNAPAELALLALAGLLARATGNSLGAIWLLAELPVFLVQLACVEMIAGIACVAARSFYGWRLLGPGLVVVGAVAAVGTFAWAAVACAAVIPPMAMASLWLTDAMADAPHTALSPSRSSFVLLWMAGVAGLYGVSRFAYGRFRERLRPRVMERPAVAVWAFVPFAGELSRRYGPSLVAQVRRDWRLTLRGFSPAAGFCIAAGVLPHLAAWVYIWTHAADARTVTVAAQTASAMSSAALGSVAFFLLSYELRYFWVEKTAASSLDTIWQSKVVFGLIVSAPGAALAAGWGALLHPGTLSERGLTALACLVLGPLVASLMGMFSFEVANRPGLGVLLSALVAVGAAILTALQPAFWVLLIFLYGQGMYGLAMRAKERVRFTEIEP